MKIHLPRLAGILYQVSCIKGLTSKNTKYKILNTKYPKAGFTLIELLVVIGILTILLAIVLIAINPGKQFAQANNTQRRSDVNAILNAIHQYAADKKGELPGSPTIDTTERTICKPTGGGSPCATNAIDLCTALAPKYLANMPRDPKTGTFTPTTGTGPCDSGTTAYDTQYSAVSTGSAGGNRITVKALAPEDDGTGTGGGAPTISVTR